jgi:hypothetical protein
MTLPLNSPTFKFEFQLFKFFAFVRSRFEGEKLPGLIPTITNINIYLGATCVLLLREFQVNT